MVHHQFAKGILKNVEFYKILFILIYALVNCIKITTQLIYLFSSIFHLF